MKISILPVLMGLFVASILPVQAKFNQIEKSDFIKPGGTTIPGTPDTSGLKYLKPPPIFKIHTVKELQTQTRGAKPILLKPSKDDKNGNLLGKTGRPMTSFYKTANGLVLDALKPKHAATGSELQVFNVVFSPYITNKLSNNMPCALHQEFEDAHVEAAGPEGNETIKVVPISAIAHFMDLPSGSHTYLLSYGTTLNKNRTTIKLDYGITQSFKGDQLTQVPGSNEIRVLFTYNPHPGHTLTITIEYDPHSLNDGSGFFNHLQLVQLD